MFTLRAACVLVFLTSVTVAAWAQAPHQVGGFVLGENIAAYEERLQMSTALPLRFKEYLYEVEIRPDQNFKSGVLTFADCAAKGRIARIKLKYLDSSKAFFEQLLQRYKERFGPPDEWRGDPFHILIAWKWSFLDEQNNNISVILQHNTKDPEQKLGNVVKLTHYNLIEAERQCHEAKPAAGATSGQAAADSVKPGAPIDWEHLLPR